LSGPKNGIFTVQLVISDYVLVETGRSLARKSPQDLQDFEIFHDNISFEIVNASKEEVLDAARYTTLKDAPIVAAAKKAGVDYLVSLDRRHLVNQAEVARASGLKIVLPEEIVREVRHG
jgi:predicted nucleic acid-binding protein